MKPAKLKMAPLGTALGLHGRGINGGHALRPHSKLAKMSKPWPPPALSPRPISSLAKPQTARQANTPPPGVVTAGNRVVPNAAALLQGIRNAAIPKTAAAAFPPKRAGMAG